MDDKSSVRSFRLKLATEGDKITGVPVVLERDLDFFSGRNHFTTGLHMTRLENFLCVLKI